MIVCIVNYNTQRLTECAIRSLLKHTTEARVVVFDNSDQGAFVFPSAEALGTGTKIEIIDNTKGQVIDFEAELAKYPNKEYSQRNRSNFGSAKHTMSIDWLMDYCAEGFVLADSDVLFRQDITPLVKHKRAAVGSLQVKDGILLLKPVLCWINVPMLKEHRIRYFNGEKMWALHDRYPYNRYDTGAWFYEELIRHRLSFYDTDIDPYILHFGHGSWKEKDPEQWLNENKELWI